MMKLKKILVRIGIYGSIFISGLIFQRLIDFSYFEISKEIDLVNVFSLLVTIWLAIIVATVIDKQRSNLRNEKDLIIKKVETIFEVVEIIQTNTNKGSFVYSDAASLIKRLNTSLQTIYKVLDKTKLKIKNETKLKFKSTIGELRDLLTNTPKSGEFKLVGEKPPLVVKDGILEMNNSRISIIESKCEQLKNQLLELEIEINSN
jgi:hypothetical protein